MCISCRIIGASFLYDSPCFKFLPDAAERTSSAMQIQYLALNAVTSKASAIITFQRSGPDLLRKRDTYFVIIKNNRVYTLFKLIKSQSALKYCERFFYKFLYLLYCEMAIPPILPVAVVTVVVFAWILQQLCGVCSLPCFSVTWLCQDVHTTVKYTI